MGTGKSGEHITLLLGGYAGACGAPYLPTQLESIGRQSWPHWSLVVSDDSPGEALRPVVADFASDARQDVQYVRGPQAGFSANFMSMLAGAPGGMLGFSDQDDVWHASKLARGVEALRGLDGPAMYCARVAYWDARGRRAEAGARRAPSFRNALIENIARGNTIVLNAAAAEVMRDVAGRVGPVFAHDWLCYLMLTGIGGRVMYDAGPPVLDYRQHAGNVIGAGTGPLAQMRRKLGVLGGAFAERLDGNIAALLAVEEMLTNDSRALLHGFAEARAKGFSGLRQLAGLGLYRQRATGTLGFWAASILGRA